ncbi:DNA double-strand break repair nuclease NurA [Pseudoalteromonas piscicida]|uniref:NurA domain-containing protein n=1 Tax=Pseudoalteromonas piscicida TaxID=43662 RepID=A0ABM6NGY2_PSEO7|nr:DNA double-strand break repair nuclease NurA [Pseudoalteromonas piscicida]ATD08280.1 hypothetical protein PPIS_a3498 [Pseudoalteromonas piscicida]WPU30331.1 DNA double-strand break repair nuclease NurA [Pseudoalteromonas piscicida]
MPYSRESAGKGGHIDLVKNPDVQNFLNECKCLTQPSAEEAKKITEDYVYWEDGNSKLPDYVVASDASPYKEAISGLFPSTQIGYVKNSMIIIEVSEFDNLQPVNSNFVDPFKVAELHRSGDPISFTLPGCNVRYKGAETVKDGFRLAVYEQLSDMRTSFTNDDNFNVVGTLLAIDDGEVELELCPACGSKEEFKFKKSEEVQRCVACQKDVYITDVMRIHEQISDLGDNGSAITRFMNVVEHLIIASFIRMVGYRDPSLLSRMAFIVDGPLAIFGQPAKVHTRLLRLYEKVRKHLVEKGYQPPLIIGIQKTGPAVEHAKALCPYIPMGAFRVIDDEYRHKYIAARSETSANFGHETYYGQDFIFKTRSGKVFVFGLVYPFAKKVPSHIEGEEATSNSKARFSEEKVEVERYREQLKLAMSLITHFELELYENAIVPIALAHRHASISLVPGGRVLEILSKKGLNL